MADEHSNHQVNYFVIFGILCGCTILSVVFDLLDIRQKLVLTVLVLGVAAAKALFVMMYFMHLKFEGRWKFVLLAPTIILALGLPMALLPDVGMHYYEVAVPQVEEHAKATKHGDQEEHSTEKEH
jgi:cytochrome c oxidase subunit 4